MNRVVITLTTTSRRITLCRAVLFSLATQSIRPDKVVINISREPYLRDEGIKKENILFTLITGIPEKLQEIFEVNWVQNTGPYRKLIPTLQRAQINDIIITADDDIFYEKDWLKSLLNNFDPESRTIHAGRVRYKRKNKFGWLTSYIYWPLIKDEVILDSDWIVTYGGGAVLCRHWFSDSIINDTSYLKIAPTSDDLWYSKICQVSGLKVKVIPEVLDKLNFFLHDDGLGNYNNPIAKKIISKILYLFIGRPMSYFRVVRYGNDKDYDSIEKYFMSKY